MPEIKNTFVSSKMNKDLDDRLIPKSEYRDAQNVSVSKSEGPDVGALENIRGNVQLTDFGLTDNNLEIIGYCSDTDNDRVFLFITNYTDTSSNGLSNEATGDVTNFITGTVLRYGSRHYIGCWSPTGNNNIIVEGDFLNFSKTHPITGVNILEDLLFWTDNRNQPRKINTNTAIANPLTYYTNEDHISVAKYAPYAPISFLKSTSGTVQSTMRNEVDEYLPACFIAPGEVDVSGVPDVLTFTSSTNPTYVLPTNFLTTGMRVYVSGKGGEAFVNSISTSNVTLENSGGAIIDDIVADLGWNDDDIFCFQPVNPDYTVLFAGDPEFLKDKFVRFSYRFKYDDDEYSLMAPFSQHAFIPEQYGYFLHGDDERTKESSIVDFMQNQVSTVDLMMDLPTNSNLLKTNYKVEEIQVLYKESDGQSIKVLADIPAKKFQEGIPGATTLIDRGSGYVPGVTATIGGSGTGFTINILTVDGVGGILTYSVSSTGEGYTFGETITVATGGINATISISGSLSNTYIYTYASQKPIRTLPEKEITRVSDIVPLRAQTQEVVGNRVIYGNFLQNSETPSSLNYTLAINDKTALASADTRKEFCNHTVKQGRSYQVGVVLMDRYGRSSNVMLNDRSYSSDEISTIYAPYTNGGVDVLRWPGDSLKITFNEEISAAKTNSYVGLYNNGDVISSGTIKNPLGWYTYKVVIKQQDQEYYNVYVPGILSGNINYSTNHDPISFTDEQRVAHISLFNDNINKVPRDLKEVGATDTMYGSETVLYNRVYQPTYNSTAGLQQVNQQFSTVTAQEVTTLRPFRDLGEWTAKKNIDNQFTGESTTGNPAAGYVYPGATGNVDPVYLENNKNPIIGTLSTKARLGFTAVRQNNSNFNFSKNLCVFETEPFHSNLEIYFETSTSGTIKDLNTNISNALPVGALTGISPFVFSLSESDPSGYQASNTFEVISGSTQVNDPLSLITLDSVTDGQTPPQTISGFSMHEITPGVAPSTSPTFGIKTTKDFVYDKNSNDIDNWEFHMTATSPTISPNQSISITETGFLGNVKPVLSSVEVLDNNGAAGGNYNSIPSGSIPLTSPIQMSGGADGMSWMNRKEFNDLQPNNFIKINRINGTLKPASKQFWNGSIDSTIVNYERGLEFDFDSTIWRYPARFTQPFQTTQIRTGSAYRMNKTSDFMWKFGNSPFTSFNPAIKYIGGRLRRSDYTAWSRVGSSFAAGIYPAWVYDIPIILWDANRAGGRESSNTYYIRLVIFN